MRLTPKIQIKLVQAFPIHFILVFFPVFFGIACNLKTTSQAPASKSHIAANEKYKDFLSPDYYSTDKEIAFVEEVNKFLHYAKKEPFHNPFKDETGHIQTTTLSPWRQFGVEMGPRGGAKFSYHPADDFYVGDNIKDRKFKINLYAVYDGYIRTYRDAPKYREYLSITKEIKGDNGKVLGKIVTLYAHIDLDLDEADGLKLNGKYVNKGDLISKHLWSGTRGGPHLHFEIRFYRADDEGTEVFYGSMYGPGGNASLIKPSAGDWSLGHWDPDIGYGFGNPRNFGLVF